MRKCQIGILNKDGTIKVNDWLLNTSINDHLDFLQDHTSGNFISNLLKDVDSSYNNIQDLIFHKGDFPVFILDSSERKWFVIE